MDQSPILMQVLTGLEYLDLWGSKISNNGASILEMFPRLSFLNLAWTKVTRLPYIPSITCLNLSNCNIHAIFSGENRAKIPLSKLLLIGATVADPNEVIMNVEANNMTFLDISCSSISNFDFLVNMRRLEHLDLSSSKIGDSLIEHIMHVGENLRYLNLSKTKITSQTISALVGYVANLETLSLSYTAIDDASLPYIGMMTSLRTLDICHTKVTGFLSDKTSSLRELQNLRLLENLNLEETLVRDEALYPLAFFRELKYLHLKSDHLSDIGLHSLSSPHPKLQILGFRGGVLTNSGLLLYSPPPMLHTLDLRGNWLLTPDAVSLFCTHRPRIKIRHEHTLSAEISSASGSSPFSRTTQASRLRGSKLSPAPNFVDERIQYKRGELLEMQHSHLSSIKQTNLEMLPAILRELES